MCTTEQDIIFQEVPKIIVICAQGKIENDKCAHIKYDIFLK